MRTPQLPAVNWTDAPADLNGLIRFTIRRNRFLRVPSHCKRSLPILFHDTHINAFPSPVSVLAIIEVLQSKPDRSQSEVFLSSKTLSFLRLNFSTSNFCAACLLTASFSQTFAITRWWSVSQSVTLKECTLSILECHLLSICDQSDCESSHQERSRRVYECFGVRTSHS